MLSTLETLKTDLENKSVNGDVVILINSTTSKAGEKEGNYQLSVRRSHAVYLTVLKILNKNGTPICVFVEIALSSYISVLAKKFDDNAFCNLSTGFSNPCPPKKLNCIVTSAIIG